DMVKRHVPDPPSAYRADVPPPLDGIVMKALAKDPNERYGSARLLTEELSVFVEKSRTLSTRDAIGETMHEAFGGNLLPPKATREQAVGGADSPHARSVGRIMDLQETRMSDENKGGSDLDIFEGLGKK